MLSLYGILERSDARFIETYIPPRDLLNIKKDGPRLLRKGPSFFESLKAVDYLKFLRL